MKKVFFYVLLAVSLVACKDETSVIPGSGVLYVNAIPEVNNFDIFNNAALIDTGLVYGDYTPYYLTEPGNYNVAFSDHSTGTALASVTTDFASNGFYSVFTILDGTEKKAVVIKDNLVQPATDSCYVRFLHFSPDAGGVDVAVTGGDILFSTRIYNDQEANPSKADFTELAAGTYNLEVRPIGSGTPVLLLPNTVLEGGKIYTIYARGLVAGMAPYDLSAGILVNYP